MMRVVWCVRGPLRRVSRAVLCEAAFYLQPTHQHEPLRLFFLLGGSTFLVVFSLQPSSM